MRRVFLAGLLVLGGLALAEPALAQTGTGTAPAAAFPTQSFKDWALDCLIAKGGASAGKRVCFIHHEAKDTTDPKLVVARAVIRHTGADRKLVLIIELPPNTVQASGASAAIDGATPLQIPISGCIKQFCYGATEVTPTLLNALRVGQQMTLRFTPKDLGLQSVPIPLSGITAALAALEKTGA
jgi:invasion protein IalB